MALFSWYDNNTKKERTRNVPLQEQIFLYTIKLSGITQS